jgi:hypothetical protein
VRYRLGGDEFCIVLVVDGERIEEAIAASVQAMTTDRPYRAAISRQAACAELRAAAGTQFDPEVVDIFIRETDRGETTHADPGQPTDPPLQALADRVRSLLSQPAGS